MLLAFTNGSQILDLKNNRRTKMKEKKKIIRIEGLKKTVKKPYKAPQLIIHGSLDEITAAKSVGNTDGAGAKSH